MKVEIICVIQKVSFLCSMFELEKLVEPKRRLDIKEKFVESSDLIIYNDDVNTFEFELSRFTLVILTPELSLSDRLITPLLLPG